MSASKRRNERNLLPWRRSGRISVRIRGGLRQGDRGIRSVEVTGLSSSGYSARCETSPRPGTEVVIVLPGIGETLSRIVWADGSRFGAEFIGGQDLRRLFVGGLSSEYHTSMRLAA